MQRIAEVHAQAGDLAAAFDIAERISGESSRPEVLQRIALAQAEAGDVAGARITLAKACDTAQSIPDETHRAEALQQIAQIQIQTGDLAGASDAFVCARDSTLGIADEDQRAKALHVLARTQAKEGFFSEAVMTANRILVDRNRHLCDFATGLAEMSSADSRGLDAFKQLLLPYSIYLDPAYQVCASLASSTQTTREPSPRYCIPFQSRRNCGRAVKKLIPTARSLVSES